MKVKKNDTVLILTGKDAGKTGKVLEVFPKTNKVKVEGINIQKKSKKARSAQEQSQIVEQIGAIDASNVEVICSKCNKAVRVAYQEVDGKKVRICRKCGANLDEVKPAKVKKSTKKADDTAEKPATKRKTTKKAEGEVAEKPAKKTTKKKVEDAE